MKHKSNMSLMLALVWTFCLLTDIICAAIGDTPTWVLVFCPLGILVLDRWGHYIEDYMKEKHDNEDRKS
jgi:hypothetical protein